MQPRSYDPRLARAIYARWLAAHDQPAGRRYARALADALAAGDDPEGVPHPTLSATAAQAIRTSVLKCFSEHVATRHEERMQERWIRLALLGRFDVHG